MIRAPAEAVVSRVAGGPVDFINTLLRSGDNASRWPRRLASSAVLTAAGSRYVQEGYGPRLTWREKMRRCLSAGAHFPPLLVMDPIVARLFVERGMDTKQKLIDWCAENARLPAREYWDDQWVQTLLRPLAVAGV